MAAARKVARKSASKKASRRKVSGKKSAAKKSAAKKPLPPKKKLAAPKGFKRRNRSGVLVPADFEDGNDVVPQGRLEQGISEAKDSIRNMALQIADSLGDSFDLTELELEVSFSADGKFMGFGVGGATSVRVKFVPTEE